jgi:DNA (cytosine-5)-methyltransferase 1
MGVVLGDLAALGFDSEWHCIPVSALGADHIRDRVWIIANDAGGSVDDHRRPEAAQDQVAEDAADPDGSRELQQGGLQSDQWRRLGNGSQATSDTHRARRARWRQTGKNGAHAGSIGARLRSIVDAAPSLSREHWDHQPVLGRGIHGVRDRVDRIAALGNAVHPKIPEMIGLAILQVEAA